MFLLNFAYFSGRQVRRDQAAGGPVLQVERKRQGGEEVQPGQDLQVEEEGGGSFFLKSSLFAAAADVWEILKNNKKVEEKIYWGKVGTGLVVFFLALSLRRAKMCLCILLFISFLCFFISIHVSTSFSNSWSTEKCRISDTRAALGPFS